MTKQDSAAEQTIRRALIDETEGGIPCEADVWPIVQRRLAERAYAAPTAGRAGQLGRLRRTVAVAALACTLVTAGGVTAMAASPQVRSAVHHAVATAASAFGISVDMEYAGGTSEDTGSFTVSPLPPFRVAELTAIPAELTPHQFAYGYVPANPPRGRGGIIAMDRGMTLPHDIPQHGPAVWFYLIVPRPGTSYLEVVEEPPAPGYSLPSGEVLSIAGVPATVQQQGDQTTMTLSRFGTMVTIRTNMGRDVAIRAVQALAWH
jgi:hypothetical protein